MFVQLCAAYDLVARAASPNNLAADQLLANLASQREAAKICGKEGFGRLALIGCGGTEEGETRSKLTLRNPEENNQAHTVFFFCQLPFCQPLAWSVGPKDLKGRRTWDLEGRHRGFVGQHFFCINNISDFST